MLDRSKTVLSILFWLYSGLFCWGWLREWLPQPLAFVPFLICVCFAVLRLRRTRGRSIEIALSVLVFLMHLQYGLGQPLVVRGESMEPTLQAGAIVWVNKLSAGLIAPPIVPAFQSSGFHRLASWSAIEKSSIVVIRFPGLDDGADAVLVKRVVALPGDRFEFRDNRLFVNDVALSANGNLRLIPAQPVTIQPPVFQAHLEVERLGPLAVWAAGNGLPLRGVVPANAFIVLGDHVDASRDSRSFGFVPVDYIMGTVANPTDGFR